MPYRYDEAIRVGKNEYWCTPYPPPSPPPEPRSPGYWTLKEIRKWSSEEKIYRHRMPLDGSIYDVRDYFPPGHVLHRPSLSLRKPRKIERMMGEMEIAEYRKQRELETLRNLWEQRDNREEEPEPVNEDALLPWWALLIRELFLYPIKRALAQVAIMRFGDFQKSAESLLIKFVNLCNRWADKQIPGWIIFVIILIFCPTAHASSMDPFVYDGIILHGFGNRIELGQPMPANVSWEVQWLKCFEFGVYLLSLCVVCFAANMLRSWMWDNPAIWYNPAADWVRHRLYDTISSLKLWIFAVIVTVVANTGFVLIQQYQQSLRDTPPVWKSSVGRGDRVVTVAVF